MRAMLDELLSLTCICGAAKCTHQPFCTDCYVRLPISLRGDLWEPHPALFDAAYAAARQFLKESRA